MSIHAEMARYRRDGRTDGQTAFQLYIVDYMGTSVLPDIYAISPQAALHISLP